jgi:hypothetical protein
MININFKIANQEQIEKAIFRGTFIVMILIVVIGFIILLSEIGIIRKETNKLIFANTNSGSIQNLETSQNPSS